VRKETKPPKKKSKHQDPLSRTIDTGKPKSKPRTKNFDAFEKSGSGDRWEDDDHAVNNISHTIVVININVAEEQEKVKNKVHSLEAVESCNGEQHENYKAVNRCQTPDNKTVS